MARASAILAFSWRSNAADKSCPSVELRLKASPSHGPLMLALRSTFGMSASALARRSARIGCFAELVRKVGDEARPLEQIRRSDFNFVGHEGGVEFSGSGGVGETESHVIGLHKVLAGDGVLAHADECGFDGVAGRVVDGDFADDSVEALFGEVALEFGDQGFSDEGLVVGDVGQSSGEVARHVGARG